MINLKDDINLIKGKKVIYSCAGGAYCSTLFIRFENRCAIWARRYWEISKCGILIACSEDDATADIGIMAVAARMLIGSVMDAILLDDNTFQLGMLFENGYSLWLYPEKEQREDFKPLDNWEYDIPFKGFGYVITSQLETVTRILVNSPKNRET